MVDGSWNGLVGFAAAAVAWTFAVFLWRANPEAVANRRLAIVLVFEGLFAASLGVFVLFVAPDAPRTPARFTARTAFGLLAATVPWLYLLFLGTLRTPWVAPFAGANAHRIVLIGLPIVILVDTAFLATSPVVGQGVEVVLGPGAYALVSFYALGVSISAWRRAPRGTARRDQARAFAVAFGVRDVLYGVFFAIIVSSLFGAHIPDVTIPGWPFIVPPIILLVYVPLVAYGILKWQLFDIDIKLKLTIKRSTLAAVFVAAFFAVSEGAALFFEDTTGNAALGIAGAALLLFFLNPLSRLAQRVSDAAMPGTHRTPEYLVFRKFQVYQATLERALADGVVRQKERAMLDELRRKLEIAEEDAERLEHETRRLLATRT